MCIFQLVLTLSSAVMKLCENHSCDGFAEDADPLNLSHSVETKVRMSESVSIMQECTERSLQMLKETSLKIISFAEKVEQHVSLLGVEKISPFVLHCIYRAMITLSWLAFETGDQKYTPGKLMCQRLLQRIDVRWKAAGKVPRNA
jgi:hypothetical protein